MDRVTGNNIFPASGSCDDQGSGFTVPEADKSQGIMGSDLHIYINYVDTAADGWAAFSSICAMD